MNGRSVLKMKKLTTVIIDKMMRSLKIFMASLVLRCLAMAIILSYGVNN
jgi:hypothetical protein